MPVRPITPQEASTGAHIPDIVFTTINKYLQERGGQDRIVLQQEKLMQMLEAEGIDRKEAYDKRWIDIEPYYIKAGWSVTYDKPGYNEEGSAYFVFEAD